MPRTRHSSSGGGIVKAKVGGKLVKKIQRKNKSNKNKNLPYSKPFLMALLCRRRCKLKQRINVCVKKASKTACVKTKEEEAAKICDSPKLDDRYPMTCQERRDLFLKIKKSYMNKVPTYVGYSSDEEDEVQPLDYPTLIQGYRRLIRSDDDE